MRIISQDSRLEHKYLEDFQKNIEPKDVQKDNIRYLMEQIDASRANGNHELADELDGVLDDLLDRWEHRLQGFEDESEDDLLKEDHSYSDEDITQGEFSVELAALYDDYLRHFSSRFGRSDDKKTFAEVAYDILVQSVPFSLPTDFDNPSTQEFYFDIAKDLYETRQNRQARIKSHAQNAQNAQNIQNYEKIKGEQYDPRYQFIKSIAERKLNAVPVCAECGAIRFGNDTQNTQHYMTEKEFLDYTNKYPELKQAYQGRASNGKIFFAVDGTHGMCPSCFQKKMDEIENM